MILYNHLISLYTKKKRFLSRENGLNWFTLEGGFEGDGEKDSSEKNGQKKVACGEFQECHVAGVMYWVDVRRCGKSMHSLDPHCTREWQPHGVLRLSRPIGTLHVDVEGSPHHNDSLNGLVYRMDIQAILTFSSEGKNIDPCTVTQF
ncbi:hypothetical protein TNCV_4322021 [Trichonephila clavipes]|uniref:Uncharacterized protein n=1 Tax=Trichonephila clavipes TaxID=2585209 RepID=A0A8X6SDN4_TRICX|nr:hypothetical protein TNCV_4322021 [Trichonephila clavipes]